MASIEQKMANNMNMMGAFSKATELKSRILFTLVALIIYRVGAYIPLPGVDVEQLRSFFEQNSGGVLDMFNMFTGGALGRMALFTLGIMPYITASIVINLMTVASKKMEALKKEGEQGRRVINQYTRYLTIIIACVHGYGVSTFLQSSGAVLNPGPVFQFVTVVTFVGSTMFLMWLGEQITARGIGNGISLLIFAGIVAELPKELALLFENVRSGQSSILFLLAIFALAAALIALIVYVERAQRRIPVQYPRRQVGNKMYEGQQSYLPLRINMSGVIPAIFASALLLVPTSIASFAAEGGPEWVQTMAIYLGHGKPLFIALYAVLIVFFCFFYTNVQFNPDESAENLKKGNGYVPGIRPGKNTSEFLSFVVTRLTTIGAAYMAFVCIVPELFTAKFDTRFILLGGTSLLIIVSVIIDTISQVQGHLISHQYDGLMKKANFNSKRRGGRMR